MPVIDIEKQDITESATKTTEVESEKAGAETVELVSETIRNIYEEEQTLPIKAVYQNEDKKVSYQYTSTDIGVKEEIVLEEVPEKNVFTSILEIPGLTIRENAMDEGLTIYDGDEIVAGIQAPNMNDATEEAYSEDVTYELQTIDEKAGKYQLILTVDEDYLTAGERQYPVVIDPTITWSGDSKVSDVYVLSGTDYKSINFYDSGITAFHAGKVTQGISRTYLALASLSDIDGRYVESATLTLTESSSSDSGQTVNVHRVTASWSKSSITWNNKPAYASTVLSSITTSGTNKTKYDFDLTSLFQGYAKKTYSNYGILIKNSVETGNHGRFYGARNSTADYRPKLTIVHYDPPTVATSVYFRTQYVKKGSTPYVMWRGITSQSLSYVQYRMASVDPESDKEIETIVSYSSSTKLGTAGSGSKQLSKIAELDEGVYKIYVRGVDTSGITGEEKGAKFIVDGNPPTLDTPVITPVTTESAPTTNLTPTISWSNASDTYLKNIIYSIDDGNDTIIGTSASGTYTLPEGVIDTNGEHTIIVSAVDMAGNETSYELKYYVQSDNLVFEKYFPNTDTLKIRSEYGKNIISWESENELSDYVYYRIYRGTTADFTADEDSFFAEKVKGNYWIDIQSVGDSAYYYKVEAVRVNTSGTVEENQLFDTVLSGQNMAADSLQKRTGRKDYWGFYQFETPIGTGTIENSSGNLNYSQEDVTLQAKNLILDVTRNYNSQMNGAGMFGTGWSDSLHKELLVDADGNVYLLEGDGSIFTFEKGENSYSCKEKKGYVLNTEETADDSDTSENEVQKSGTSFSSAAIGSLKYALEAVKVSGSFTTPISSVSVSEDSSESEEETTSEEKTIEINHSYAIKTEDEYVYRFNQYGQLVSILEPNGAFLLYLYNADGKLDSVYTENEQKLSLAYDETTGLLDTITLPDETTLSYEYDNNQLKKVTHSSKDKSESVSNSYGYTNNLLSSVTDRRGKEYTITYNNSKPQKVTYPNQESYTLDYQTNKTTVTKKNAENTSIYTTSVEYDSTTGKKLKETGADGLSTTYEYGDENNTYLVTKTKRLIGYQILNDGTVEFKTEEKITETTYDEKENITSETSEDGTVTEYTYGDQSTEWTEDLPTEIVSEKDGVTLSKTTTTYDDVGNVETETDATDPNNQSVTTNQYDAEGNLIQSTVKENGLETSKTETTYDEYGNVIAEKAISSDVVSEEESTYDVMGRVLKTTDKTTGEVTSYTYDYLGRVIQTESAINDKKQTSSSSYDANGTVILETDTLGVKTSYTYDSINRLISRTVAKNESITYTTDYSYGNVKVHDGIAEKTISNAYIEKESYSDGSTATEKYYDANGKLVKEKSSGLYVDHTYDESGNEVVSYSNGTEAEASDGKVELTLYDAEGRQTTTIVNPTISSGGYTIGDNTIATSQTYDKKGNVVTETDAEGIVTSYTYDNSSRVTQVTQDSNGQKVTTSASYATDVEGGNTTTTITDAEGHKSVEVLDAAGLTQSTTDYGTDDESIATAYEYDSRGNQTKVTYANGAYKIFAYDDQNLLSYTEVYNAENERTLGTEYIYDDYQRLIKTIDEKISRPETSTYQGIIVEGAAYTPYRYTYIGYDAFGRKAWISEVNGEEVTGEDVTETQIESHKITYIYDAEDKITGIRYALVEGDGVEGLNFVYDNNRWLTKVQAVLKGDDTEKTVREYTYDIQGKVSETKEYPDFVNGGTTCITKSYTYNTLDQVTSMIYKNGSEIQESYAYKYDKNGNIIEKTEINNTPTAENDKVNETKKYTYDTLGRLTKTVITDHLDSDAEQTISYEYDKVGNRTKKTQGSTEVSYTYNGLDQLLKAETTRGGATAGTSTYTYDANGNQTKEINTTNQTTTINEYDEENRLSKVTITSLAADGSTNTFTQENLYNGEGQRVQKIEDAKTTNYFYQDGVVSYTTDDTAEKVIQNLLGLEGNIISAEETGDDSYGYYLYNKDIQGSTTSILDSTGACKLSYEYDDFGETEINGTGTFENEVCYTGGIYDASTGLYYLNARYYDPTTGRFLTEDTYRGESGDVEDWHLYVYCNNNPINYIDPTGHWVETALDVISIGWSAASFVKAPSWTTLGALLWDVGASFIPFVPGSYTVKAYKVTKKGKQVSKISLKVASEVGDLKKGKKFLTIGKYKGLRKILKGKGSKYQCHHIIEKRLGHLSLKKDNYPSIVLTKELHQVITNRWNAVLPRGKKHSLTKKNMINAAEKVYKDMPELKKVAVKTIKRYYK